jgi:hypothetical protein
VVDRSDDASTTTTAADSSTSSTLHHLEGRSYARGSCVIWNDRARERADAPVKSVPCDQPHFLEMTGSVDLPGEMNFPTDEPTWDAIQQERCTTERDMNGKLGDDCRGLAARHLGRPLARGEESSWLPITQEEWDNGWRTLPCLVGRWHNDKPVSVTGPMAAA